MDTTRRILRELEEMIAEGKFSPELEQKIKLLMDNVRNGAVNLISYRKADSKERYGLDIIEAIIEANRRQY